MHLTGTCLVLIGLLNVSVAQLASLAAAALGSLARKEVLDLMAKHVIPKIPDLLEEGIKLDFHENSLHFRFLINIVSTYIWANPRYFSICIFSQEIKEQ